MENKRPGAAEHAIVGAGVGVAGAANTIGLIGLSAGTLAALPMLANEWKRLRRVAAS